MDDKNAFVSGTRNGGITVVEAEVVAEPQLPLLTTTTSLSPKLPRVSFDVPPPSRASGIYDPSSKSRKQLKDSGWPAWRVLVAAILVQGTLFAFPLTFGVFQDFFSKEQKLSNSSETIWIGVLSTGVPFLAAPFTTVLFENHSPARWRYSIILGWAICAVALIGASFSKSIMTLALTQGALYALGLIFIDVPTLLIVNTWFLKRRGTAYGVLFGVTDLTGFGMTILAEWLLRALGLRGALLTFACTVLICGPAIYFLRPLPPTITPTNHFMTLAQQIHLLEEQENLTLTPLSRRATSNLCSKTITTRYYRLPIFYIFALANLLHALAYYLPFIYLPSYATSLGYTPTRSAFLLAAGNFSQIFGEISFGNLSDRINVHWLILTGSLMSSVATLTMWGLAQNYAVLVVFALVFGSFGSGMISLWARMGTFFGQRDAQMIFSIMSLGRGVGSITSGPISSALLRGGAGAAGGVSNGVTGGMGKYGGGKYAGVVLFVGASMAASAMMGVIGLFAGLHGGEKKSGRRKQKESFQELKEVKV